jgi:Ca-activated chloride channel family protein
MNISQFLTGLVLLTMGLLATPRAVTADQRGTASFSLDVSAVALDVVVTDASGRFVRGLTQDDFQVLEDTVPQEVTFFTSEGTPATTLVLLDSSSSVRANLKNVQNSANRFIDRLPRGDAARIGFFHDRVVFGPAFTDNMKQHVAMINQMRPQRSTHLYDALIASLRELATVQSRKALVVFTDGDDEGSEATMADALEAARRSRVSIYTIGLRGWSATEGIDTNEELLTAVAEYTGGRSFLPENEKDMREAFDDIAEELHQQYRMAYFPPNNDNVDGWRDIDVNMTSRRGLIVRTRLGYHRSEESPE